MGHRDTNQHTEICLKTIETIKHKYIHSFPLSLKFEHKIAMSQRELQFSSTARDSH